MHSVKVNFTSGFVCWLVIGLLFGWVFFPSIRGQEVIAVTFYKKSYCEEPEKFTSLKIF